MIDSTSQTLIQGDRITASGRIVVAREHVGVMGHIYTAYRCAFKWYIKDANEQWRSDVFRPYRTGPLLSTTVNFTDGMDLATLAAPMECWMGYSVGGDHTEMLAAGRYGCVLTIMPTDIKPWIRPPQEGERIIRVEWKEPGADGNNGDTTPMSDGSYRLRLVQAAGWRDLYALACQGHELNHALKAEGNHD